MYIFAKEMYKYTKHTDTLLNLTSYLEVIPSEYRRRFRRPLVG